MSSSTPNIGLTLPTGGERVSRQIINENNTKIDTHVGELYEQIGTLNSKLNDNFDSLQLVKISINVTIPANTNVDIDLSSFIPSGKNVFSISSIKLGNYILPYINGEQVTNVEQYNTATNTLIIKNSATAWTNYNLRIVLFVL